jgi:hypothetical protein
MPERRGRVTFGLADADTLVNPALPATRWRAKGGLRSTDRRVGLARRIAAQSPDTSLDFFRFRSAPPLLQHDNRPGLSCRMDVRDEVRRDLRVLLELKGDTAALARLDQLLARRVAP